MSGLPIPAKGTFYDLNIPCDTNPKKVGDILILAKELGYSVVALSKYISSGSLKKDRKGKKAKFTFEEPVKQDVPNMLQLSRVTIELGDVDDQITVRDVITQGKYDIIAVQPKTEKLFLSACTQLNVNIITLDGTEKTPFFKTHQVRAAISRGIHFEICYAPMIRDPAIRRVTITNAIKLVECCKGRNIILSSNSLQPSDLRAPYDVANLGLLFGLAENVIPHTVSHNCRSVVVHSFTQKTAKGAIFIQKLDNVSSNLARMKRGISEEVEDQPKRMKTDNNQT